jgi:hypothetical protein
MKQGWCAEDDDGSAADIIVPVILVFFVMLFAGLCLYFRSRNRRYQQAFVGTTMPVVRQVRERTSVTTNADGSCKIVREVTNADGSTTVTETVEHAMGGAEQSLANRGLLPEAREVQLVTIDDEIAQSAPIAQVTAIPEEAVSNNR